MIPGATLRLAVGKRSLWRASPNIAVLYNLQATGDSTGVLHFHTVDFGLVPPVGESGWRLRTGLGAMALTTLQGDPGLFGLAVDTGVGYAFGLGHALSLSFDLPLILGIPFPQPAGAFVTATLVGIQAGLTFGGTDPKQAMARR